ncbi:ABC transporter ATP-binding protein [Dysosmobacter sp.]
MAQPDKKRTALGSETLGALLRRWQEGTFGELLEDWRWIFSYTKHYRRAVLCYVLLGITSASLGLVSAVASKASIDIITGFQTSKLGVVAAIMVSSALMSLLLRSLISRVSTRISLYVTNDIQAALFEKILDADYLALSGYSSGDLLSRFNSDITTVAGNAISWLPNLLIGLYTFAATFLVILHYDRVMALIALASAPFLLLSSRYLLGRMRRHNRRMKEMASQLMAYEVETFGNLDTIKSFGLMERYGRGLRRRQEAFKKANLDYNLFSIKTDAVISALGSAVQLAAFGYCLYLLWSGRIVYGTMTLFLSQSVKLSTTFSSLVGVVPAFLTSAVSARRIRELEQLEREPRGQAQDTAPTGGVSVRAEGVTFSYGPGRVIFDSAFQAEPGEIVALIGPSGQGKTTLIRLILGLVRPQAGRVFLRFGGGEEEVVGAGTRQLIAYVPQGNTILSGTIAENLLMVKEDATREQMEEALRLACAWEFVEKLPGGLDAGVGERGRGLSEGQAQRLAIARAILKDAPVLLLDEATSALDVATERRVLRGIAARCPGKTCIVTTHRPSVLGLCRRVYCVTDGRVTELDREESRRLTMEF